jgi:8-oxo-dGTP pyrophosphatase MutT (NUDIX family)
MSPLRPDLIECWVFRLPDPASADHLGVDVGRLEPEFLLIRRAPGRIFPGLWQCVTGGPEPAERIPHVALREVAEETGIANEDIEAFYDLDMVSSFYDEGPDAIVSGAIFAMRVRPTAQPRLSAEHDAYRWASADEAKALVVWPSYGECLDRIRGCLLDPVAARWFELDLDGHRLLR